MAFLKYLIDNVQSWQARGIHQIHSLAKSASFLKCSHFTGHLKSANWVWCFPASFSSVRFWASNENPGQSPCVFIPVGHVTSLTGGLCPTLTTHLNNVCFHTLAVHVQVICDLNVLCIPCVYVRS